MSCTCQIVRAVATCQCTVAALVARWNSQCFWNYLDWDQIVQIVYMSSVYGIEFQVRVSAPKCHSISTNTIGAWFVVRCLFWLFYSSISSESFASLAAATLPTT